MNEMKAAHEKEMVEVRQLLKDVAHREQSLQQRVEQENSAANACRDVATKDIEDLRSELAEQILQLRHIHFNRVEEVDTVLHG